MCMLNSIISDFSQMGFEQIKNNTCGLSACRAIIRQVLDINITENDAIARLPELINDVDRMDNIINNDQLSYIQTDELKDFLNLFDIRSNVLHDVHTSNLKDYFSNFNLILVVIYNLPKINPITYHAILINKIDGCDITYFDPQRDVTTDTTINSLETLRVKDDGGHLEILYLLNR